MKTVFSLKPVEITGTVNVTVNNAPAGIGKGELVHLRVFPPNTLATVTNKVWVGGDDGCLMYHATVSMDIFSLLVENEHLLNCDW